MRARKLGLIIAPFAVALAIGCGLKTIGERPVDPSTDASPDTYVEPFPDVRYEASPGDDGGNDGGLDAPWAPSNLPGVPGLDAGDAGLSIASAVIDTTTVTVTSGSLDGEYALEASADGKYVVLVGTHVTITKLQVLGTRPLVVVALEDLVVDGNIQANAILDVAGPGGGSALNDGGPGAGRRATDAGAGDEGAGGGGAGHGTPGASGGQGAAATVAGDGGAAYGAGTQLFGGSVGGAGKANSTSPAVGCSQGGGGGGAIQLTALGKVMLVGPAVINVSGGGGRGSCNNSGGGGGGSGGTILVEAKNAIVLNGGTLFSAGGSGGSAGGGSGGNDGIDPTDPLGFAGGAPKAGSEGDGGNGGWEGGAPTPGGKGNKRGGGGGGAVGRVVLRGKVEVLDASVSNPGYTAVP